MATVSWIGTNGDWGTAANWSPARVPVSSDDVVINTANIYTVTFSGGDNSTVHSLTVGNDHFNMSGGILEILSTASFANGFTQTGGSLTGSAAVSITGPGILTGGYAGGSTAFTITGTIALANYTLGGSASIQNSTQTNETGQIVLGDNTGVNATINNHSGAVYSIAGDYGIGLGATSALFVNAGTLQKSAGSGVSYIDPNITNTGTITAATGSLVLRGPNDSYLGLISGAGQVAFGGGGVHTIQNGTTITVASLGIYDNGTTVKLGENLTYSGTFSQGFGSDLNLGGHTVTLSGPSSFYNANFGTPVVNGTGALITKGTTTLSYFVLGGTVTWTNLGTVSNAAPLTIGDSTASSAHLNNRSGAVFNLSADVGVTRGQSLGSDFTNAGLVKKTAGNGTSFIDLNFISTGTVTAATGSIDFRGPNDSYGGSITGAGQVVFGGGGVHTIQSGTTITVATLGIYDNGTTVDLAGSLGYSGMFNQGFGSDLNLGGNTLTLSGPASFYNANFGTPVVNGSGTLVTQGATNIDYLVIGGTVVWQNAGTVSSVAPLTIGDGSSSSAHFVNNAGGVFNLTADVGVTRGQSLGSDFTNAGLVEKTAGSGTSYIDLDVTSTGTVTAATGSIEFRGPNDSYSGSITGAGQVAFGGGGVHTIQSGTTITVTTLGIYDNGTTVDLAGNLSYSGTFNQGFGSDLNLSGNTLTLSGPASFYNANFGTPVVNGSGTLLTQGATSISYLVIGGTVVWQNTGTVSSVAPLTIGDGSTHSARVVNNSGAVYDFTNDAGIGSGTAGSSFSNAGRFEKTAGTGTSFVDVNFTNTGTVSVATGAIEFRGLKDSFTGLLTGAGTIAFGGGGSDTINSVTTLTVANLGVFDSGTNLTFATSESYAGTLTEGSNSTLTVAAGRVLSLSGAATLSGSVTGPGSLALTGGTAALNGSLGVASLSIGNKATLGTNLSFAGAFSLASGAALALGSNSLSLTGTANLAGAVTGGGTLALSTGATTLASTAQLTVSNVTLSGGASLTLSAKNTYAGTFIDSAGTVALNGQPLTLSGVASFTGATVIGTGNLLAAGTAYVAGLTVTGGGALEDTSNVIASGALTLGGSGGAKGSLWDTAAGTYDLINDVGIAVAIGGTGSILNNGLLEKTGGAGTSVIGPVMTNNGRVVAASGTLDVAAAVSGTGSLAVSGISTIEFDSTVASTQSLSFTGSGSTLTIGSAGVFSAGIHGFDTVGAGSNDAFLMAGFGSGTTAKFVQSSSSQGTLTITFGGLQKTLTLFGQYSNSFAVSTGGNNSLITYTGNPSQGPSIAVHS